MRGFTLIELLIVISIIALLIGILLPSLSRSRVLAKRTVTLGHLRGIGTAMAAYHNNNNDLYPALIDREEKAFLGFSLLGKQQSLDSHLLVNPNTMDALATSCCRVERNQGARRSIAPSIEQKQHNHQ